ncbi:hypothetical protein H1R20_g13308, partial [Candolleomyces eurysporus]
MAPTVPSRPTSPERDAAELAADVTTNQYERRARKGGIYDQLVEQIAAAAPQFIASGSVMHGVQYLSHYVPAQTNNGWNKLSFKLNDSKGEEFRTCIFGEMGGTRIGTAIGAKGNFYSGKDGDTRVIEDNTTVRNIYMLTGPEGHHELVRAAWDNQIHELNNAFGDIVIEFNLAENALKGIVSGDPRGDIFAIRAAGVPIYKNLGRATNGRSALPSTPATKRTVISTSSIASMRDAGSAVTGSSPAQGESAVASTTASRANYIEGTKVTEQTTYDVSCLPDHAGPMFKHQHCVVVQPRIIDVDGKTLVKPWQIPEKLRPGTLVLMEGTFSVWFIPGGNPVFQYTASAIKILDESDEEPQLPTIQEMTPKKPPTYNNTPKRLSAFEDFGSPVKKPKSQQTDKKDDSATKSKGKGKARN